MCSEKIIQAVSCLNLDLKNKVVLTEAATGAYAVTAVIAALAGAKVFAYTQDTKYGSVADVKRDMFNLIDNFNIKNLNIEIIDKLDENIISQLDIITNSGHLRPLNEEKLRYAKDSLVIPLMYEAWEWREADLDLEYCRKRGFRIGATNERHPDVDVFSYLGDMALRLIFDSGKCLYKNKFVLICNNDFGPFIAKTLALICNLLGVIDTLENKDKYPSNVKWLCEFPEIKIPDEFIDADAILFTAYPFDKIWIGDESSPIPLQSIVKSFSTPFLLRYCGDIDTKAFTENNVPFYPVNVKSGHMGILPSDIGFDPIIRLQAAGLKVGECLLNNTFIYNGIKILDFIK